MWLCYTVEETHLKSNYAKNSNLPPVMDASPKAEVDPNNPPIQKAAPQQRDVPKHPRIQNVILVASDRYRDWETDRKSVV